MELAVKVDTEQRGYKDGNEVSNDYSKAEDALSKVWRYQNKETVRHPL